MPATPTESTFELTTIERLKKLGYRYQHGGEIERDLHSVVLDEPLRTQLSRRYRHLPAEANAVVGIFYEARHIPLDLANQKIDADLEEIAEEQETVIEADKLEQAKAKWAAIERAAGTWLMRDDLEVGKRRNLARYRSFRQMLDEAITCYNNRTIQAADVVAVMVEIRQQQLEDERRKQALGLNDEELAFYDVVALSAEVVPPHDDEWIAGLVREVTASIKTNLKVDWTRAHQSAVYASVQSAVGRVLQRRGMRGEAFEFLRRRLMLQAEAMYEEWPMVA